MRVVIALGTLTLTLTACGSSTPNGNDIADNIRDEAGQAADDTEVSTPLEIVTIDGVTLGRFGQHLTVIVEDSLKVDGEAVPFPMTYDCDPDESAWRPLDADNKPVTGMPICLPTDDPNAGTRAAEFFAD